MGTVRLRHITVTNSILLCQGASALLALDLLIHISMGHGRPFSSAQSESGMGFPSHSSLGISLSDGKMPSFAF